MSSNNDVSKFEKHNSVDEPNLTSRCIILLGHTIEENLQRDPRVLAHTMQQNLY